MAASYDVVLQDGSSEWLENVPAAGSRRDAVNRAVQRNLRWHPHVIVKSVTKLEPAQHGEIVEMPEAVAESLRRTG